MTCKALLRSATVLTLVCAGVSAGAQDFSIALATPLQSLDPHERNVAGHNSVIDHVFETLVGRDQREALRPALAESWIALDALTWEFKLRKGVQWHDGTPFSVDDVIASLKRVAARPDGATSFGPFTRRIESVGRVDAHTLRIRTLHTHPLLPHDLASIRIVPARVAESAESDNLASRDASAGAAPNRDGAAGSRRPDAATGRRASADPAAKRAEDGAASVRRWIGTGPYRLTGFVPGERVTLERNDAYWGIKPAWQTLTLRFIARGPARVAALLAGEVQMIEDVPGADLARIAKEPSMQLASAVTNRLIYLHLDSERKVSPFATAKNGKPLPANPLQDARVRRAMSLAIDRGAIVSRHRAGRALPAGQLLPQTHAGTSRQLGTPTPDVDGARRLLAEAGYPDGFSITLHTPRNRYPQDMPTAHAVAGMLARAGIRVRVEALPADVFFTRMAALDFSFYLAGWSTQTGEASSPLRALIGSYDARSGMGQANRGRFSDPAVDSLIRSAMTTIDEPRRNALLASATEKAIGEQQALIPLLHEMSTWALRKGFEYAGRTDQATYGFEVRPSQP